jgi:hypothetical protein
MYLEDAPTVAHEGCGTHLFSLVSDDHATPIVLSAGEQSYGRDDFAPYLGTVATNACSRQQLRLYVDPTRASVKLVSLGSVSTVIIKRDGKSIELPKDGTVRLLDGYSIAIRPRQGELAMKLQLVDKYDMMGIARRLKVTIPRQTRKGATCGLVGHTDGGHAKRPRVGMST